VGCGDHAVEERFAVYRRRTRIVASVVGRQRPGGVVKVTGQPVSLAAALERPGALVRRLRRVEVRALTFDVFGTLLDWRSTMARAFGESRSR
jgi:hypothetical protein